MWSRFCKNYKQGSTKPGDDKIAGTAAMPDMSSYVAKQSTFAANAFLSTSHKKGRPPPVSEEGRPPVSGEGGSSSESSATSSDSKKPDSAPHHVQRPVKNERSALSVLQDVLLGRD
jgi:hypothetical protein